MQFNDAEFSKLIADVEKEFSSFLAKAEKTEVATSDVQVLAKSDDEGKKEEPKKEEKEEKEEPKHESEPEHKDEPKEHEQEEKPEHEHSEEHKEEPKEEGKEEGHGYDDEDMKHMHEMYGSMNQHELKAHHDSVRMALDKCMGMDKEEEAPMEMSETMAKSETIEIPDTVVNSQLELIKSELSAKTAETEELKKSNEELKKSFDLVTQLLNKLVKKSAPQAKAVTSVEAIAKSEPTMEKSLAASEVTAILRRKAQDPSLKKSDRDLINAYVLQGASIQTINHLLK